MFATIISPNCMTNYRSNRDWLDQLRGLAGAEKQHKAHLDLGHYLHTVGFNYLLKRQLDVPALYDHDRSDLSRFAQDSVQDVLEKLARDDFALLDQYREEGRFLAWTALITRNHIAGQLRLVQFSKRMLDLEEALFIPAESISPTNRIVIEEVIITLQECVSQLPEHMSFALIECILKQRRSKEVALEMGRTENAVNLLVMRAKQRVSICLQSKGIGPDVLKFFE